MIYESASFHAHGQTATPCHGGADSSHAHDLRSHRFPAVHPREAIIAASTRRMYRHWSFIIKAVKPRLWLSIVSQLLQFFQIISTLVRLVIRHKLGSPASPPPHPLLFPCLLTLLLSFLSCLLILSIFSLFPSFRIVFPSSRPFSFLTCLSSNSTSQSCCTPSFFPL